MKPTFRMSLCGLLLINGGMIYAQTNQRTPEFDRLIHRGNQAHSWASLDAVGLADSALQTLDAERSLGRPDPNLPAARIFQLALKLAAEKNDVATMDRLARGANQANRKELFAAVNATRKTAGQSRTISSATRLPVDYVNAEILTVHKAFLHDIQSARLSGDARLLKAVLEDIETIPDYPEALRENLKATATEAHGLIEDTPEVPAALNRLVGQSREIRWQGINTRWVVPEYHSTVDPPSTWTPPRPRPTGPALGQQRAGQSTVGQTLTYEQRQAALQLLRNPGGIKPSFAK